MGRLPPTPVEDEALPTPTASPALLLLLSAFGLLPCFVR